MYMIILSNIYDITSIYQSAYFKFLRPTERGPFTKIKGERGKA